MNVYRSSINYSHLGDVKLFRDELEANSRPSILFWLRPTTIRALFIIASYVANKLEQNIGYVHPTYPDDGKLK